MGVLCPFARRHAAGLNNDSGGVWRRGGEWRDRGRLQTYDNLVIEWRQENERMIVGWFKSLAAYKTLVNINAILCIYVHAMSRCMYRVINIVFLRLYVFTHIEIVKNDKPIVTVLER